MRYGRVILVALACSVAWAHAASTPGFSGGGTFNAPAVKIDTEMVSIREVQLIFSDSYKLIQDKVRAGMLTPEALQREIQRAWSEALDTATQDKIIDMLADKTRKDIIKYFVSRSGQELSAQQAIDYFTRQEADEIRRLRRELIAAAGGEDELKAALKRRGQTLDEWEKGLSRELFRRYVLSMRLGAIVNSPAAAKAYFEKHPEQFHEEDAWQLRRIKIPKAESSTAEIALEKAKLVRDKINSGASFGDIAVKVSDDPQFAKQGGLLSRGGKTELPSGNFPGEEKIAQGLKDGELSQPIDVGDWFVIVQRVGYRAAATQTFEQASEKAEGLCMQEQLKARKKELFEKLKRDAYIDILEKDPPPSVLKMVGATGN